MNRLEFGAPAPGGSVTVSEAEAMMTPKSWAYQLNGKVLFFCDMSGRFWRRSDDRYEEVTKAFLTILDDFARQ